MSDYKFKYTAFIGYRFRLQAFEKTIKLKLAHSDFLGGEVGYIDDYNVYIYTNLSYNVGQGVSIGGYPLARRYFQLEEISITDFPKIEGAKIIKKEVLN